jgi:hypothetical protein
MQSGWSPESSTGFSSSGMYLQRHDGPLVERARSRLPDPVHMKNRPAQATRQARQVPLDHLRPGARPRTESETGGGPPEATGPTGAEPAEPVTPGGGDADAARGKATRSPAAVATRPHLEGSEQGPS